MFEVSENPMADYGGQAAVRLPLATMATELRICEALSELDQAQRYANDVLVDPWQFAIPAVKLFALGLTENDLRWLQLKGCVELRMGIPADGGAQGGALATRQQEPSGAQVVMGRYGQELLRQLSVLNAPDAPARADLRVHYVQVWRARQPPGAIAGSPATLPRWDATRSELRLGDALVKQYRLPAPNQRRILATFEEERWPRRIDDPLSPHPEIDSKRRLHHTLIALNRNQKQRLLQFHGDGTGQGIYWSARGLRES